MVPRLHSALCNIQHLLRLREEQRTMPRVMPVRQHLSGPQQLCKPACETSEQCNGPLPAGKPLYRQE